MIFFQLMISSIYALNTAFLDLSKRRLLKMNVPLKNSQPPDAKCLSMNPKLSYPGFKLRSGQPYNTKARHLNGHANNSAPSNSLLGASNSYFQKNDLRGLMIPEPYFKRCHNPLQNIGNMHCVNAYSNKSIPGKSGPILSQPGFKIVKKASRQSNPKPQGPMPQMAVRNIISTVIRPVFVPIYQSSIKAETLEPLTSIVTQRIMVPFIQQRTVTVKDPNQNNPRQLFNRVLYNIPFPPVDFSKSQANPDKCMSKSLSNPVEKKTSRSVPAFENNMKIQILTITKYVKEMSNKIAAKDYSKKSGLLLEGPRTGNISNASENRNPGVATKKGASTFDDNNLKDLIEEISSLEQDSARRYARKSQFAKASKKNPNLDDGIQNTTLLSDANMKRYYNSEDYGQSGPLKAKKRRSKPKVDIEKDTVTKTITQYSRTVTCTKETPLREDLEGFFQRGKIEETSKDLRNAVPKKLKDKPAVKIPKISRLARKSHDFESSESGVDEKKLVNNKARQSNAEASSDINSRVKGLKPSRTITVFNHLNSDIITVDLRKNKKAPKSASTKIKADDLKGSKLLTYIPSKLILNSQPGNLQPEGKKPVGIKDSAVFQPKYENNFNDSIPETPSTDNLKLVRAESKPDNYTDENPTGGMKAAEGKRNTSSNTKSLAGKSSTTTSGDLLYRTITKTVTHNYTIQAPAITTNSAILPSTELKRNEKARNTLTITNTSTVTVTKSKASPVVEPEISYRSNSTDTSDQLNHRLDELERSLQSKKDDYIRIMNKVVNILERDKKETINSTGISEGTSKPYLNTSSTSEYKNTKSQSGYEAKDGTIGNSFADTRPGEAKYLKSIDSKKIPDGKNETGTAQFAPKAIDYPNVSSGSTSLNNKHLSSGIGVLKNPDKIVFNSTNFDPKSKSIYLDPEKTFSAISTSDNLDKVIMEKLESILLPVNKADASASINRFKGLDSPSIYNSDSAKFSAVMDVLRKYNMTIGPNLHKDISTGLFKPLSSAIETTSIPQSAGIFPGPATDKTHIVKDALSASTLGSISTGKDRLFSKAGPSILIKSASQDVSESKATDPKDRSILNKELTAILNSLLFKYGKCISTIVIKTPISPPMSISRDSVWSASQSNNYSEKSSSIKTLSRSSIINAKPVKFVRDKIDKLADVLKFNVPGKSSFKSSYSPVSSIQVSSKYPESLSLSIVTLAPSVTSTLTITSKPSSSSVYPMKTTSKYTQSASSSIGSGNRKSPLVEILDLIAEDNLGVSNLVEQGKLGLKDIKKPSKTVSPSIQKEDVKGNPEMQKEKIKNELLLELMKFINSDSRSEEDIQKILNMIKIVKDTKAPPSDYQSASPGVDGHAIEHQSSKISMSESQSATAKKFNISKGTPKKRGKRTSSSSFSKDAQPSSVQSVNTQVITVINGTLPTEKKEEAPKSLSPGSNDKNDSTAEKRESDEKSEESSPETEGNLENDEEAVSSTIHPKDVLSDTKATIGTPENKKPYKTVRCCYMKTNCKIKPISASKIKSADIPPTSASASSSMQAESAKPSTLTVTSTLSEYVTTTEVLTKNSTVTERLTVTSEKSITVDRKIPVSTTVTETKTLTKAAPSTVPPPAVQSSSQASIQPAASLTPITISYTQTIKVPFNSLTTAECTKKQAVKPSISTRYVYASSADSSPSGTKPRNNPQPILGSKSTRSSIQKNDGNIGTIDIIDNFKIIESNEKGKVIEVVKNNKVNESSRSANNKATAKRKKSKRIRSAEITLEDLSGDKPRIIDIEVPFDQLKKLIKNTDEE